ncbi:hypothetical protein C8R44DRAFT_739894 [Mycena epipterygia]|nr:hypothetical protein C8R44DRAFT_739894 [Mycena epipterygia]
MHCANTFPRRIRVVTEVSAPRKTGHPTTKRPLTSSRRILQYDVGSSAPEASAVNDCRPPLRSRPSFEVDVSPTIEDIHSFPSLGNVPSSFDGFNMLPDQSVQITDGGTADTKNKDTKTTIQETSII